MGWTGRRARRPRPPGARSRRALAGMLGAVLAGLVVALAAGSRDEAGDRSASATSGLSAYGSGLAAVAAADQAGVDRARGRLTQLRANGPDASPTAAGPTGAAPASPAGALERAGLTEAHGPAVTVTLDDTPRERRAGPWDPRFRPPVADDLVVHQQDVQAVVNALWAGGARAMTIMGIRVTARTAVRCVGNTLRLEGGVYAPPFAISAIGDQDRLVAALEDDPDVVLYRQYVAAYDLGYRMERVGNATFPAADLPSAHYATPLPG
ncbi:DUF881 domain-containing protein [Pseudofrankia sp. EUN1h]|uniref:DUF881 domain-containing protein n=1 Tax=Pseudofrankia sp. EUN1h TaxID=1834515 RepID=UPI000234C30B|nr:DUF881 domain-containing protein [Pseudofrankia sp. EUN1h]